MGYNPYFLCKKFSSHQLGEIEPRQTENNDEKLMAGAWDSKSFAVSFLYPHSLKQMRELHEAMMKKDFAIFLGEREGLWKSGLVLAIVSKLDKSVLKTIKEADTAHDTA